MKTIIQLDVPDWQIGQDVTVYFPDTMMKHAKCKLLKEQKAVKVEKRKEEAEWNVCSNCGGHLIHKWSYCPYCGRAVMWE